MTSMTSMTALSHDCHDCHAEFKKFEFSGHYKSSAATRRHWLSNTFGNEIGMHWMLLIATLFFNINKSSLLKSVSWLLGELQFISDSILQF